MRFHELTEGVEAVNVSALAKRMAGHVLANRYWDRPAARKRKIDGSDALYDMVGNWRGQNDQYWPEGFGPIPADIAHLPDEDFVETPFFAQVVQKWARTRAQEVVAKLSAIPRVDGGYRVHRIIAVRKDWIEKVQRNRGTNLGLYWTYDIQGWAGGAGAYAVWSKLPEDEAVSLEIEAVAPEASVDWPTTVLANMDWLSGDSEHELRLLKGAPIQVVQICLHEDDAQCFDVSGMSFCA